MIAALIIGSWILVMALMGGYIGDNYPNFLPVFLVIDLFLSLLVGFFAFRLGASRR